MYSNGRAEFSLLHAISHEVSQGNEVPDAIITFIRDNCSLRSGDIATQLRKKFADGQMPEMARITPNQIRYHWAAAKMEKYKRHEEPIKSAVMFLGEQQKVDIVCRTFESCICLGITTPLFHDVMNHPECEKDFYVDSTYGTNKQGMELFVCMATINGEGYPISYLVLSSITAAGGKVVALKEWFSQLKMRGVLPEFIFMDKDQAEITAAKSSREAIESRKPVNAAAFRLHSFLTDCAKYNLPPSNAEGYNSSIGASSGHKQGLSVTEAQRCFIHAMMNRHFHRHMLIPRDDGTFPTALEIRAESFREIVIYCMEQSLESLLMYMYTKWYCDEMWSLWCRSSAPTIPLARTNMLCESHFKYLKHNPLHHNHRPRLDFLFFILVSDVMNHFVHKLQLRQGKREHPRWWQICASVNLHEAFTDLPMEPEELEPFQMPEETAFEDGRYPPTAESVAFALKTHQEFFAVISDPNLSPGQAFQLNQTFKAFRIYQDTLKKHHAKGTTPGTWNDMQKNKFCRISRSYTFCKPILFVPPWVPPLAPF
ncbi:hypothetical protein BV898_13429 [Hypsibius exemplaris]|uniref:MULE transposase domain-containing protein n=1 Tax=Hypsibius exemplaris TaxID=2072580 RepID=A0A1W0WAW1_HYPEX|nr:hypothetical protein BV898_13429 [Hypsibius exemplaris]